MLGVRPEHFMVSGDVALPPRSSWSSRPARTLRCIASSPGIEVTVVSRERHTFTPGDTIRLQPLPGKTYLSRFDAR